MMRTGDGQIISQCLNGDPAIFGVLVDKYKESIYGIALSKLGNFHDAQDITQETFIKAYRALANFRGESAFYTWLYRIAINTAKNYLVSQSRRPPDTDIDAEDAVQFEGDSKLRETDLPEQLVHRDELERVIYEAIDALPDDLRTAITLRELEGLSYEEIAQAMDCPIGTVRSRIFRAREAIEAKLKPLLESR